MASPNTDCPSIGVPPSGGGTPPGQDRLLAAQLDRSGVMGDADPRADLLDLSPGVCALRPTKTGAVRHTTYSCQRAELFNAAAPVHSVIDR